MACKICGKQKDTYTLEIPYIEDIEVIGVDEYHICGSCWDIIAEVANRRLSQQLEELSKRILDLEIIQATRTYDDY